MNGSLDWKGDLEGLTDKNSLRSLSALIDKRKRQRSKAIRLVFLSIVFLFVVTVLGIWIFAGWPKSIRADVSNGVIALELAFSALIIRSLPTISKDEVEQIINTAVLSSTFSKIKAEVGSGSERLHRWMAFFAAAALLAVILLKSFVLDPEEPKNNKEVDHGARQVSSYGCTLSTQRIKM